MSFFLGLRSKARLMGAHVDLQEVISLAIKYTQVDFTVLEVKRSEKRQKQLVASGASKTMNSRHLTGHAADLGALVGGRVSWDWPLYYEIARSVQRAAKKLGVEITWGGVWDRPLNSLSDDLEEEVIKYQRRRKAKGKKAFLDGPHFQLSWDKYP